MSLTISNDDLAAIYTSLVQARGRLARNRTFSQDPVDLRAKRALEAEDMILDVLDLLATCHERS
jgi:hypothetical protein